MCPQWSFPLLGRPSQKRSVDLLACGRLDGSRPSQMQQHGIVSTHREIRRIHINWYDFSYKCRWRVKAFVTACNTVPIKTAEQQAHAMLFRTRELLIGQRAQLANALRGHLAEHGHLAPIGLGNVVRLSFILIQAGNDLPDLVRDLGRLYLDQVAQPTERIDALDVQMADEAKQSAIATRLRRMPGIGPVTAMVIETFAPDMASFRRGRDFAAWLGLVPRQHSSGGKCKLGCTSKMGSAKFGDCCRHLERAPQRHTRLMAGAHAPQKAAYAGRHRTRQQDGAGDLGDDCQ